MKLKNGYPRLLVSDFKACFLFYRDVLGLDVVRGNENDGDADFKIGNLTLGLFERREMADIIGNTELPLTAECQDGVALVFEVQDLDDACQELRHSGVEFATDPMHKPDWGIKTAYFRDPDGNLLGIYEFVV
jgi:catechol 2,3-dioxygenase-like lactoylglutathione lyase family enzyme